MIHDPIPTEQHMRIHKAIKAPTLMFGGMVMGLVMTLFGIAAIFAYDIESTTDMRSLFGFPVVWTLMFAVPYLLYCAVPKYPLELDETGFTMNSYLGPLKVRWDAVCKIEETSTSYISGFWTTRLIFARVHVSAQGETSLRQPWPRWKWNKPSRINGNRFVLVSASQLEIRGTSLIELMTRYWTEYRSEQPAEVSL
ncbi:MAG: hypothetical protein R8G34_19875 [Paracoccaceae bacterium]|nr:hypothetical protein [Paracoccaceae bacterium]